MSLDQRLFPSASRKDCGSRGRSRCFPGPGPLGHRNLQAGLKVGGSWPPPAKTGHKRTRRPVPRSARRAVRNIHREAVHLWPVQDLSGHEQQDDKNGSAMVRGKDLQARNPRQHAPLNRLLVLSIAVEQPTLAPRPAHCGLAGVTATSHQKCDPDLVAIALAIARFPRK